MSHLQNGAQAKDQNGDSLRSLKLFRMYLLGIYKV